VNVSVLVPWQPGCPHREAAWNFLRSRWERVGEVIVGTCEGPWVKAAAVADALTRAAGDVLVIADADVWVDPSDAVAACATWAVPHLKVHRLSEASTAQVLNGADWRRLPLDASNPRDRKPYVGQAGGGVTVVRRDVYEDCPIPRIVGWGQEDESWAIALQCLYGKPWRGNVDLVHLWHPPQPRRSRVVGSDESRKLRARFRSERSNPTAMRELIKETAWPESYSTAKA
jgi:hypothetical protein